MKKLILLLVVCGSMLLGCGPQGKDVDTKNMPIEQQFVIVSLNHFVEKNDPQVSRAKELIERAAKTYVMSTDLVGDQAYTAYKLAKENGIQVTGMEVLEAATLGYVRGSGADFATSCSMYITLRKSDMPHAEAMMAMKGMFAKIRDIGNASRR